MMKYLPPNFIFALGFLYGFISPGHAITAENECDHIGSKVTAHETSEQLKKLNSETKPPVDPPVDPPKKDGDSDGDKIALPSRDRNGRPRDTDIRKRRDVASEEPQGRSPSKKPDRKRLRNRFPNQFKQDQLTKQPLNIPNFGNGAGGASSFVNGGIPPGTSAYNSSGSVYLPGHLNGFENADATGTGSSTETAQRPLDKLPENSPSLNIPSTNQSEPNSQEIAKTDDENDSDYFPNSNLSKNEGTPAKPDDNDAPNKNCVLITKGNPKAYQLRRRFDSNELSWIYSYLLKGETKSNQNLDQEKQNELMAVAREFYPVEFSKGESLLPDDLLVESRTIKSEPMVVVREDHEIPLAITRPNTKDEGYEKIVQLDPKSVLDSGLIALRIKNIQKEECGIEASSGNRSQSPTQSLPTGGIRQPASSRGIGSTAR